MAQYQLHRRGLCRCSCSGHRHAGGVRLSQVPLPPLENKDIAMWILSSASSRRQPQSSLLPDDGSWG